MVGHNSGMVLRRIHALFDGGTFGGLSDRELLDRFLARRDEVSECAFAALVERHGPMVLGVCRRWLVDPDAAEDAFQATFLVLVRKAGSIRVDGSVGRWLFGVATRVASRARADARRRRVRERPGLDRLEIETATEESSRTGVDRSELRSILAEELGRLPPRFQAAVVLCDLEGSSHEEAARRLGWPVGTVKSRLARARVRLRQRLTRRGLTPSDFSITPPLLPIALPRSLTEATTRAAQSLIAGRITTTGIVTASVATLTEGVLRTMFLTKLKLAAVVLLAVATGSAVLVGQATGQKPPDPRHPGVEAGPAPATGRADQAAPRDDELDIILLERAWVEAIPRRDAAIVNRIMAEDFEGIDPAGNRFTKATYMPDLRNGVFTHQPIVLDEIAVRLFGDTGVATSRIKIPGDPTHGRMTNVYVKRQGRWQCVASHASGLSAGACPAISAAAGALDLRAARAEVQPAQPAGPKNQCVSCHTVSHREAGLRPDPGTVLPARPGDPFVRIRPRFPCIVERVHVGNGESVKQGDPLVGLLSFDLAEAKTLYQIAGSQWRRDQKILDAKRPMAQNNTLPMKELMEAENDEAQSRAKLELARNKLRISGLTEAEIEQVEKENGEGKTRLTLRSPVAGTVVQRAAVLGNHYDANDVLMVIQPTSSARDSVGHTH